MSLARHLQAHGLGHLTLRDLAKIETAFGVRLVEVTSGPPAPTPTLRPSYAGPFRPHPYPYAYAA